MLELCTKKTVFTYQNTMYEQTDGMAKKLASVSPNKITNNKSRYIKTSKRHAPQTTIFTFTFTFIITRYCYFVRHPSNPSALVDRRPHFSIIYIYIYIKLSTRLLT